MSAAVLAGLLAGCETLKNCETSDGVYRFLDDLGIKGLRGSGQRCPVATYLSGCANGERLWVDHGGATHQGNAVTFGYHWPQHVSDFIRAFDRGSYPSLEAPK